MAKQAEVMAAMLRVLRQTARTARMRISRTWKREFVRSRLEQVLPGCERQRPDVLSFRKQRSRTHPVPR